MNILSNRDYGYVPENEFVSKAEKCREMYEIIDFRLSSNTEKNKEQDVVLQENAQTDKLQSEAINKNAEEIASQQKAIAEQHKEIEANEKAIQEQKQAIEENEKAISSLVEGSYISQELSEELSSLLAQVSMLETKVNDMSKSNIVEVLEITQNNYNNLVDDLVFTDVEIKEKTTINSKSITMNGVKTSSNDNRLALK